MRGFGMTIVDYRGSSSRVFLSPTLFERNARVIRKFSADNILHANVVNTPPVQPQVADAMRLTVLEGRRSVVAACEELP